MYFYFYRKHWFGKVLGRYLELFCAVVNILTKTIYSNLLMSHKFISVIIWPRLGSFTNFLIFFLNEINQKYFLTYFL